MCYFVPTKRRWKTSAPRFGPCPAQRIKNEPFSLCKERTLLRRSACPRSRRTAEPGYLYYHANLEGTFNLPQAFAEVPHLVCFSAKANSNLACCGLVIRRGIDIVSGGALPARKAVASTKIVYSGVGKTEVEIHQASRRHAHVQMLNRSRNWKKSTLAGASRKKGTDPIR